ncbi:MAG: FliM/FliN family flagellar motor switch protein [Planctomycetes bacterium]|nr:FliM/FliN family flagellar motor switch protein [Planctomycetota bacterium]
MAPQALLTQDEIEALLELVESGGRNMPSLSHDAAPGGGHAAKTDKAAPAGGPNVYNTNNEIAPRDFTKPDQLPRDEFDRLQGEAAHAAARISDSLARWLRLDVRAECVAIEIQQYKTFLAGLMSPCLVFPIKCGRESASLGVLSADTSLVLAIVDRTLGGKGKARFAARALSSIELPMANRLCGILLKSLADGFSDVLHVEKSPAGAPATQLRQARLIENDTNVIIATYSIGGELAETEVRFVFPAAAYPKNEGRAAAPAAVPSPPAIPSIAVEVAVRLGSTDITIRDLLALDKGDVISLDQNAGEPARIDVEGNVTATARVGTRERNFAVVIESIVRAPAPSAAAAGA